MRPDMCVSTAFPCSSTMRTRECPGTIQPTRCPPRRRSDTPGDRCPSRPRWPARYGTQFGLTVDLDEYRKTIFTPIKQFCDRAWMDDVESRQETPNRRERPGRSKGLPAHECVRVSLKIVVCQRSAARDRARSWSSSTISGTLRRNAARTPTTKRKCTGETANAAYPRSLPIIAGTSCVKLL